MNSTFIPTITKEYSRGSIDNFLPLIVAGFVALILGWMIVRYKMSHHRQSNFNGAVYCCPDECFKFFENNPHSESK